MTTEEQERNSQYWKKRINNQQDKLYDKSLEDIQNELAKKYEQAIKDIKINMVDLYNDLLADASNGEISMNDLYCFNRYSDLQRQLNKKLVALGKDEIDVYNRQFEQLYKVNEKTIQKAFEENGLITGRFTQVSEKQVKAVLDSVWCSDGMHWSNRVWRNKALLQQRIEKGLVDCVSRGVAKDEIIKQLKNDFGVGFNQADAIARTELTYIMGQSTANSYKSVGVKQYQYLAALDSRTSDICKKLNGKVFDFADMQIGKNYPPCHVNCRSTVIPIFDK